MLIKKYLKPQLRRLERDVASEEVPGLRWPGLLGTRTASVLCTYVYTHIYIHLTEALHPLKSVAVGACLSPCVST